MKSKILFLLQLPPPVHGASLLNLRIFENSYLNQAFEKDLIQLRFSRSLDELSRWQFRKLLTSLKIIIQIIRKCRGGSFDLVFFTFSLNRWAFYRDVIFLFWIRLFNKKTILYFHERQFNSEKKSWLRKKLLKYSLRKVFVIQHTQLLYEDIKIFIPIDRVFFIPLGIPQSIAHKEFERAMDQRARREILQILYLSHLNFMKGFPTLLHAAQILQKKGLHRLNINFVGSFAGKKEQLYFFHTIEEADLDRWVYYHGPKFDAEKTNTYLEADIFIFPTQHETFGLVNLEAMEAGLPVVSTMEGSIPEIVDNGKTGFLVPAGDPEMLAEKIEELTTDRQLRLKMGRAGREKFLKKYTLDHFLKNMADTLIQLSRPDK